LFFRVPDSARIPGSSRCLQPFLPGEHRRCVATGPVGADHEPLDGGLQIGPSLPGSGSNWLSPSQMGYSTRPRFLRPSVGCQFVCPLVNTGVRAPFYYPGNHRRLAPRHCTGRAPVFVPYPGPRIYRPRINPRKNHRHANQYSCTRSCGLKPRGQSVHRAPPLQNPQTCELEARQFA